MLRGAGSRRCNCSPPTAGIRVGDLYRVEPFGAGDVVDVQIDLLPLGLSYRAGEQLRFVVSGGEHPSYLQLPVQAAPTGTTTEGPR